jgi:hypothetical protein
MRNFVEVKKAYIKVSPAAVDQPSEEGRDANGVDQEEYNCERNVSRIEARHAASRGPNNNAVVRAQVPAQVQLVHREELQRHLSALGVHQRH